MNKFQKNLSRLIGRDETFTPQAQVFHCVNLVTVLLLSAVIIVNALLGLLSSLPLIAVIAALHFLSFYLSRYKGKIKLAITGFFIVGYGGFIASYFGKSGIGGPALLIGPFIFLLVLIVVNRKYHLWLILLNILTLAVLFTSEYQHPGWISSVYRSRKEHFIDQFSNVTLLFLATYFIIAILINSYIKQRKKAQLQAIELIEKNKALQKVTLEKDRLFSLVFHDLKSPLTSTQFYLEQFSILAENGSDHKIIRDELLLLTRSTSEMLETMLHWIKEQISAADPKIIPTDIQAIIKQAVLTEKAYAAPKGVTIIDATTPATVRADSTLLQILVRAILNNAIKFSTTGSEVIISSNNTADRCIISIKDKGQGIPAEIQSQIFNELIKPQLGTNRERGTGVGLMLSHQLAGRQDIGLSFESRPAEGTTFFISIPLRASSNEK